jgi:hypothetical protein
MIWYDIGYDILHDMIYNMTWYVMIWYDIVRYITWHDMLVYDIYDMIYIIWYAMIYDTISCVNDVTILWVIGHNRMSELKIVMFSNLGFFGKSSSCYWHCHCPLLSNWYKAGINNPLSVWKAFTKQLRKATFIFVMFFVRPSLCQHRITSFQLKRLPRNCALWIINKIFHEFAFL